MLIDVDWWLRLIDDSSWLMAQVDRWLKLIDDPSWLMTHDIWWLKLIDDLLELCDCVGWVDVHQYIFWIWPWQLHLLIGQKNGNLQLTNFTSSSKCKILGNFKNDSYKKKQGPTVPGSQSPKFPISQALKPFYSSQNPLNLSLTLKQLLLIVKLQVRFWVHLNTSVIRD